MQGGVGSDRANVVMFVAVCAGRREGTRNKLGSVLAGTDYFRRLFAREGSSRRCLAKPTLNGTLTFKTPRKQR